MKLTFCFQVSRMCFICVAEVSDMPVGIAGLYAHPKKTCVFALAHPQKAAGTVRSSFSYVLAVAYLVDATKVVPAVVRWICVFMIYETDRPGVSHVEPRKAVGIVNLSVKSNNKSATGRTASGRFTRNHLAECDTPRECTRVGVVVKSSAQFSSKRGSSVEHMITSAVNGTNFTPFRGAQ